MNKEQFCESLCNTCITEQDKIYRDIYGNDNINERQFVFSFLKHVRNAVCHSGDDGTLSILPLSEGTIIEEILFYDKNIKSEEEFGMRLSVEEVRKMVKLIADFYCIPQLGQIDKTETKETLRRE